METLEEYKNVRIINDEPEFSACESINVSTDFFILCETDKELFGKNIYDNQICGMSILNWVVRACGAMPKILKIDSETDPIAVVKPYVDYSAEYSVVFYADTPLLNKLHINDLINFVDRKRMNVCFFKRGFMFRNDYIKDNDEFYSIDEYDFASNDFFVVSGYEDFAVANEVLLKKVLDYHKKNGVYLENENSLVVDANTDIGYQTRVLSGANIINGTKIGENSVIGKNAVISGSTIAGSVKIGSNVVITNSIIKDNVIIGDGVIIENAVVGNNSIIQTGAKIYSSSLREEAFVGKLTILDNSRIFENVKIGDFCKILGIREKTIIGANSRIGENNDIIDHVLSDGSIVEDNLETKGTVR